MQTVKARKLLDVVAAFAFLGVLVSAALKYSSGTPSAGTFAGVELGSAMAFLVLVAVRVRMSTPEFWAAGAVESRAAFSRLTRSARALAASTTSSTGTASGRHLGQGSLSCSLSSPMGPPQ